MHTFNNGLAIQPEPRYVGVNVNLCKTSHPVDRLTCQNWLICTKWYQCVLGEQGKMFSHWRPCSLGFGVTDPRNIPLSLPNLVIPHQAASMNKGQEFGSRLLGDAVDHKESTCNSRLMLVALSQMVWVLMRGVQNLLFPPGPSSWMQGAINNSCQPWNFIQICSQLSQLSHAQMI